MLSSSRRMTSVSSRKPAPPGCDEMSSVNPRAMVIGNGQLVEAGDPVQVGSIRTENSGMEFYGFYRPTE